MFFDMKVNRLLHVSESVVGVSQVLLEQVAKQQQLIVVKFQGRSEVHHRL